MTAAPPFACPACGGSEARPWCAAPDPRGAVSGTFTLVRCSRCGCGACWPPPDDATLAAAYGGEYAPHAAPGAHEEPGPARRIPCGRPGRALVVGAGSGSNLARLRAAGWTAVGIEPDAEAVAVARAAGLDVTGGTAEAGPYPDGTFDLVWLPNVLEHVRDPVAALREAGRRLAAGGRAEVWTQNPDSWTARRFGPDWIHLDPPRHLWHFTRDSLPWLAERAGLYVARIRTRSRPRGWLASAEIRAARAGRPRELRRSRWRKALVRPLCWLADLRGAGDIFEASLRPTAAPRRAARIHVALLGEGVDVWRPVQAEHLQGDVYRILDQPHDRAAESWQFGPGDEVECAWREVSDGRILAAIRKADPFTGEAAEPGEET